MSERAFQRVLLTTTAVLTGAYALCACSSAEAKPPEKPAVVYTIGDAAHDYKTGLAITNPNGEGFLERSGLTAAQLEADSHDPARKQQVAVEASFDGAPAKGSFVPDQVDANYGEKLYTEYYNTWEISGPSPTSATPTEWLPIAQVTPGANGTIEVEDQRPPNARRDASGKEQFAKLIGDVVVPTSDLIHLAFGGNDVKSINFVYDQNNRRLSTALGDESSFYDAASKKEFIVIQKYTPEPYEEIKETVTHETAHGLFAKAPISEVNKTVDTSENAAAVKAACISFKDAYLGEAEPALAHDLPSLYEKLSLLDSDSRPEIAYILAALKQHGLASLQFNQNIYEKDANIVDECAITDPIAVIGFTRVAILHDKGPTGVFPKDAMDVAEELQTTFSNDIRKQPVLTAISEHGYDTNKLNGHPEDDVDELAASLADIALNYSDEFIAHVNNLPVKDARAVKQAYIAIRTAFVAANPDLAAILPNLFSQ